MWKLSLLFDDKLCLCYLSCSRTRKSCILYCSYKAALFLLLFIRQPELLWFKTAQCWPILCARTNRILQGFLEDRQFCDLPRSQNRLKVLRWLRPARFGAGTRRLLLSSRSSPLPPHHHQKKTLLIPSLTPTYTTTHVPACPSPATRTSLRQILLAS